MPVDEKGAEQLAKDLIAEIAAEWTDTPNISYVNEAGSYVFVYTLPPAEIVRYARVVTRPAVTSTFHFNPLAEAAAMIAELDIQLGFRKVDEGIAGYVLRREAKQHIQQLILAAAEVFRDAMDQARLVAETLCSLESLEAFGRPDIQRKLVNATVELIEQKVRERFGRISDARTPKIHNFKIHTTLRGFLSSFKETGKIPSQRQFAKALEVTPKAWRAYLTKHKLGKHEGAVKQWLEELLEQERSYERRLGSIGGGDSSQGD